MLHAFGNFRPLQSKIMNLKFLNNIEMLINDWNHFIFRLHRSTAYIYAAYCYRPSSMVCLSVCHSSDPCKNGWTDWVAVWVEDSGGPKEPCIRWGSDLPMGRGNFEGVKGRPIVKYRDTLLWAVRKRLKWLITLGLRTQVGLRNHVLDGVSRFPHWKGRFWGGRSGPSVKYGNTMWWSVQKWMNRSRCLLRVGLWWAQGSMY